jgi:hypothetical protein
MYICGGAIFSASSRMMHALNTSFTAGRDAEELYQWAPRLKTSLQSLPGAGRCVDGHADERAAREHRDTPRPCHVPERDPEKIANALYDAYGNRRANIIMVPSQRYDAILEVAKQYQQDPAALGDL